MLENWLHGRRLEIVLRTQSNSARVRPHPVHLVFKHCTVILPRELYKSIIARPSSLFITNFMIISIPVASCTHRTHMIFNMRTKHNSFTTCIYNFILEMRSITKLKMQFQCERLHGNKINSGQHMKWQRRWDELWINTQSVYNIYLIVAPSFTETFIDDLHFVVACCSCSTVCVNDCDYFVHILKI